MGHEFAGLDWRGVVFGIWYLVLARTVKDMVSGQSWTQTALDLL